MEFQLIVKEKNYLKILRGNTSMEDLHLNQREPIFKAERINL